MNPAVGIDLGTTNTVVGFQTEDSGPEILKVPQPVEQRDVLQDQNWIKSAVLFESLGSAVVGALAAGERNSFKSFKSRMGTRWRAPHPHDAKRSVTAPYLSAHVLRLAYQTLLARFPEWDRTALVTVPASFNSMQRKDTLDAARAAGFAHIDLLDEPTAAFYYHFDRFRENRREFDRKQAILVFDFGGGTLDVSVIEVERQGDLLHVDTIGRSRYNNLGGDDVDYDLAAAMLRVWLERQTADTRNRANANELCKAFVGGASRYKEEVETALRYDVPELPEFRLDTTLKTGLKIDFSLLLTQEQYQELSGRYFREVSGLNVFRPVGESLSVARQLRPGFRQDDLSLVLYTGGASQMSGARAALEAYFAPVRCEPISDDEQCHTVALGAAACRFDAMRHRQGVRLTTRLLESVFTRAGDANRYVPLVPMNAVPGEAFAGLGEPFRTQRKLIRLVHPLFRGISPEGHQLSPLGDLRIDLGTVLDRDTLYRIDYRVSRNMTVEFRAVFEPPGRPPLECPGRVELSDARSAETMPPLCDVNHI